MSKQTWGLAFTFEGATSRQEWTRAFCDVIRVLSTHRWIGQYYYANSVSFISGEECKIKILPCPIFYDRLQPNFRAPAGSTMWNWWLFLWIAIEINFPRDSYAHDDDDMLCFPSSSVSSIRTLSFQASRDP